MQYYNAHVGIRVPDGQGVELEEHAITGTWEWN